MPDNNLGKKLVLARYGQSREDAVDNILKLEDSPLPEVTKLEPHDVLVGVRSASVSFIDLLMMSGQYQTMLPLPCVPGMEYAGVVLGVGSEVDPRKIAVGDRVLSDFIVTVLAAWAPIRLKAAGNPMRWHRIMACTASRKVSRLIRLATCS